MTEENIAIEYNATVSSPSVNGAVKLSIGKGGLSLIALFGASEIAFAEIESVSLRDYIVTVETADGIFSFSKMGNMTEPFYNALCKAYNEAVLRALFVDGEPVVTASGEYRYVEPVVTALGEYRYVEPCVAASGEYNYVEPCEKDFHSGDIPESKAQIAGGHAPMRVYENCVTILPPDTDARRIPLCFVSGMDKGDFETTLRLDGGEAYIFVKLGFDTEPFNKAVENGIRSLRERTLKTIKEIDPTLSAMQSQTITTLMPEGICARIGVLKEVAI